MESQGLNGRWEVISNPHPRLVPTLYHPLQSGQIMCGGWFYTCHRSPTSSPYVLISALFFIRVDRCYSLSTPKCKKRASAHLQYVFQICLECDGEMTGIYLIIVKNDWNLSWLYCNGEMVIIWPYGYDWNVSGWIE